MHRHDNTETHLKEYSTLSVRKKLLKTAKKKVVLYETQIANMDFCNRYYTII